MILSVSNSRTTTLLSTPLFHTKPGSVRAVYQTALLVKATSHLALHAAQIRPRVSRLTSREIFV